MKRPEVIHTIILNVKKLRDGRCAITTNNGVYNTAAHYKSTTQALDLLTGTNGEKTFPRGLPGSLYIGGRGTVVRLHHAGIKSPSGEWVYAH